MAKKDDLIEEALGYGLDVNRNMTNTKLEELIEEAKLKPLDDDSDEVEPTEPSDPPPVGGRYKTISFIRIDGKLVDPGEVLELGEDDATLLLAQNAIEPV